MSKQPVLTPQSEDFPRWYQDVIAKAELAENGPVRGTMTIRPWGYAIWERIQADLDSRIKATGHENAYFPLFIPMPFFEREADHVEGFSPELAVVTHGGGAELGEPVAVRPTSETVIGDCMSRWIQSHRDLPLLLNQWANVVRWELRPRLFLRTSEFLWQEGHTAHASREEAVEETLRMHRVYYDLMHDTLAMNPVLGRKTAAERFAGAELTYTLEGLMRDGKALQMGTSHYLGQNFARAFDITFSDTDGQLAHCHTTSWGVSTRVVGSLIMTHGDDRGLRLPPRVAPVQAVVIAIRDEVAADARELHAELEAAGVRSRLDDDTHTGFGRRATDWEIKGVPVRLELGPRDVEQAAVTVVRRDTGEKASHPRSGIGAAVVRLLDDVQASLLAETTARREAETRDGDGPDAVLDGGADGFTRIAWSSLGEVGEARIAEAGYTVRCLVSPDGGVPGADTPDDGLVAYVARAY